MMTTAIVVVAVLVLLGIGWELHRRHAAVRESSKPVRLLGDDVRFVAYRPRSIAPDEWRSLLVFAHKSLTDVEIAAGVPDPSATVEVTARRVLAALGESAAGFESLSGDAARGIPRGDELSFVPVVPGVEFNPPSARFRWTEDVHRVDFRLRAKGVEIGTTLSGSLSVYHGPLVVAELGLKLSVSGPSSAASDVGPPESSSDKLEPVVARPYQKVFPSYSRLDVSIVRAFEEVARVRGDTYLRDTMNLRSGENWNERLLQLIEEADVFQLFWSSSSMRSPHCRQEWEHALGLGRSHFVRPTYWESPLPCDEVQDLPPPGLAELHFHNLNLEAIGFRADIGASPSSGWSLASSMFGMRWRASPKRSARLRALGAALLLILTGTAIDLHMRLLREWGLPAPLERVPSLDRPGYLAFDTGEQLFVVPETMVAEGQSTLDRKLTEHFMTVRRAMNGREIVAPDEKSLLEYSEAREGYRVFLDEGERSLHVFKVGSPELATYLKDGRDQDPPFAVVDGEGWMINAPDQATWIAYVDVRSRPTLGIELPEDFKAEFPDGQ